MVEGKIDFCPLFFETFENDMLKSQPINWLIKKGDTQKRIWKKKN